MFTVKSSFLVNFFISTMFRLCVCEEVTDFLQLYLFVSDLCERKKQIMKVVIIMVDFAFQTISEP